jgi:hypothetical protein
MRPAKTLRTRLIPPREQWSTDPAWNPPSPRERLEAELELPDATRAATQAALALQDAETAWQEARRQARQALAGPLRARMAELLHALGEAVLPAIAANTAVRRFEEESKALLDNPGGAAQEAFVWETYAWSGPLILDRYVEWREALRMRGYRLPPQRDE